MGKISAVAFGIFLKFNKIYYEKFEMAEEFDIMLSIRNSKDLTLIGFGGKDEEGRKYAEPYDFRYSSIKPKTHRKNIQLKIKSIKTQDMTDEFINSKMHDISNDIAHAYNLTNSRCYNYDGSFDWENSISWNERNLR